MRLLCVSIGVPNTPDPNFLNVCLSVVCPFCISCCPQLGPVRFRSNRSEKKLAPPKSDTIELYDNSMLCLLRNCWTVSHSACTLWHSCHQCAWVLVSPHPPQHIFYIISYSPVHLVNVKRNLSHCGFNLPSLVLMVSSLFSCHYCSFVYFFRIDQFDPLSILNLGCLFTVV
jgi:hypothetical protein